MSSTVGLDELVRAANAAGFSMATEDDDVGVAATPVNAILKSAEDLGRGARPVSVRTVVVPAMIARPTVAAAPKGLMSSANSVRDTVYGYLKLNAQA